MENMIKTFMKRLVPIYACSVGMTLLLIYEFSHGLLSPRMLGLALLILCIGIGVGAVLLIKKSAKEFAIPPVPSGTPIDAVTRKLLLWRIRRAKITIVIMGAALVLGLTQIRNFPVLPLLVGLAVNLLTTAISVQTVVRLQKILR